MISKFVIFLLLFCIYQCNAVEDNSTDFNRLKRALPRCGVPIKKLNQLIVGGKHFEANKYPWMAALMDGKEHPENPIFFCGGVLVTTTKVLTAAHCIYPKRETRKLPRDITVLLGVYNLKATFELGRFPTTPKEIFIHPDWHPGILNYNGDIAAIINEHEVTITEAVIPICLWNFDQDPLENIGTVIGYGKSEDDTKIHETIPKELRIPLHKNEDCFLDTPDLARLASKKTFCAGSADGTGPCLGDSGSGLFIKHNNVFYLRGIVSSSLLDDDHKCNVRKFAVYTDVLKYKNWILHPSDEFEGDPEVLRPKQTTVSSSSKNTAPLSTNDDSCGIMSSSAGLIYGGEFSTRNQFPWEAIMSIKLSDVFVHLGSGSLISSKHVLARSIVVAYIDGDNNFIPISVDRVQIFLGTTIYDDLSQPGSLKLGVTKIANHPKARKVFEGLEIFKISIVTLEREVSFTENIRPVCLWPFNYDVNEIVGRDAYVVGNGFDQTGKDSFIRKHTKVTIKDQNYCKKYYEKRLASANGSIHFCAIGNFNEGPCVFDNQLYMKVSTTWYIKGTITSLNNFPNLTCVFNYPTLYEDITPCIPWIKDQLY